MRSGSKLLPLLAGVLLLGIADSMIGPYLVLFGTGEAGLSPFRVGVFLSLIAVSGLAVSTWLGRRYDRSASRWPALVAVTAPALGYLALAGTTSYALLLLIAVGLLGGGLAAFPQLFSLARTHLTRTGGDADRRGTPVLRSVWSMAWAIGPLLGAAVLSWRGYDALMMLTALAFALVALPLLLLGRTPLPHRAATPDNGDGRTATPDNADARAATPDTGDGRTATPDASDGRVTRAMLVAAASFTLFHTAMLAGSVALPLFVTRTLERSDGDVGLLFSVCALVEIPAALGLLLVPARVSRRGLILAGMVLFTAYFALVAIGSGMPLLIGTQVARGVALAVVGALGITYMQELLPQATGRATTMFANTLTIGSLVSGVLAGATAQAVGYRATLLLCGLLAAVGCVLFAAARPRPAGALTTPEVSPQPAGR